jgi:hypothetical protein
MRPGAGAGKMLARRIHHAPQIQRRSAVVRPGEQLIHRFRQRRLSPPALLIDASSDLARRRVRKASSLNSSSRAIADSSGQPPPSGWASSG